MPGWRPSSGPDAARSRAELQQRLRYYFENSGAMAVDTPALSPYAVSDTHIESLEVASEISRAPLYLHTSPEFHMKRLLAAGYPDIYSICRVFRDGESGRNHQPEFTMVEWYRLGMNLDEIIADALNAATIGLNRQVKVEESNMMSYASALNQFCDIDLWSATTADLAEAAAADDDLRAMMGDNRDDWLDLLMSTRITPYFSKDHLTVLTHYPASQAALARLSPEDARVADRFEIFLGPVELANGYVELTDAAEQAARMQSDQADRKYRNRKTRPHDIDLLAALEHGLPPCAGVAMGLERLQMIHDGTDDIRDVITFAFGDTDD